MATIGSGEPSGSVGNDGAATVVVGANVVVGASVVVGAMVVAGARVVGGACVVAGANSVVAGATLVAPSSAGMKALSVESPPVPTSTPAAMPPTASTATKPNSNERRGPDDAGSATVGSATGDDAAAADATPGDSGGGGGAGVEPAGASVPSGGSELLEGVESVIAEPACCLGDGFRRTTPKPDDIPDIGKALDELEKFVTLRGKQPPAPRRP